MLKLYVFMYVCFQLSDMCLMIYSIKPVVIIVVVALFQVW